MDLMVDIETLAQSPRSTILSVGAVVFDRHSIELYEGKRVEDLFLHNKFYVVLDQNQTREIDANTVDWWDSQGEEARKVFSESIKVPLREGLYNYRRFVLGKDIDLAWCWGATFDHVILEDAFRQMGIPNPVPFRNRVCARTFQRIVGPDLRIDLKLQTTKHNALHDAIAQAIIVQKMTQMTVIE